MRIRLAFLVLLLVAANGRAADPSRITCMGHGDHLWPEGLFQRAEARLVKIDGKAFRARYGAFPKKTFGALEVRAALVATDGDEPPADPADRLLRAGFVVRAGGAAKYYELLGDDDEGGAIEVDNDARSQEERAKEPRITVAFAGDPTLPLLRFEWTSSLGGGRSSSNSRDVLFLDFRGTPSIAQRAQCTEGWVGGNCTAADHVHWPVEGYDCAWDAKLADVVCLDTLHMRADWTHRASTRRFAVFARKELPVRERSVRSLDALARGPRGTHFVEGVGLVKPVGTIAHRWFVYAATGTSHALVVRLWSVDLRDPAGPIRPLPLQVLDAPVEDDALDPGDVATEKSDPAHPRPRFTPDALPFALETTRLTPAGNSPDVLQLVLRDGKGRGVFWIGGDAASGALAALRVASDAGEYAECGRFRHPSSAAASGIVAKPFAATLSITPRWEEQESDEPATAPKVAPHRATITWNGGFRITPAP